MKNKLPAVSIIMPVYNRARFVLETIESISNQTWTDWELIIVDDGSIDDTVAIIDSVNDDRIRLYQAGRIGINGRIKNIGLEKARGELIAFIDSDDLWATTKIEKQVLALREYPQAGFCLTGGYNFTRAGKPVDFFYKQQHGVRYFNGFLSFFQSEVAAFTQALLFRRECLEVTGRFDETKSFSDSEFILELARNFKMVLLYEPMLFRRLHDDNHSRDDWKNAYDRSIGLINYYHSRGMLPASVARKALFRVYINFGEDCLVRNYNRKALYNFLIAWRKNPFSTISYRKAGKLALRWSRIRPIVSTIS